METMDAKGTIKMLKMNSPEKLDSSNSSNNSNGWISVKDALPKPTMLVVVAMPFQPSCWRVQGDCQLLEDCHIELATLRESKFGFSWDYGGQTPMKITHWMPLFVPPLPGEPKDSP